VTLQNHSQETERAREFARKPACSANKLRFSQNEKHFSRINGAFLSVEWPPPGQCACTPVVTAWPLSVLTVVEQALEPVTKTTLPRNKERIVRISCSVR
jgi:hypothetical protein